ncbi:unnamed protein product [Adineta ricciae]|uniref:Glycolipid transfer protein domain-containing protein n=1 Tax=Adineta ricciae TaxID=249248 RepID=A0A815UDE4_ADIRI|nr:unnamed protein product [Adineta ricciae]
MSKESRNSRSGSTLTNSLAEKPRERRSTDIGEPNNRTNSNGFDVHRVYETFTTALRQPENPKSPIGTQDYIDGYRELLKFFDQLGRVFRFVKDDVVDKLNILQTFADKDQKNAIKHFETIQSAIDYETEQNLIKTNPERNFARTLLRLHRALLFIIQFLQALNERPTSENTTTIATSCYDATLYHHHGFLVRNSVRVGFRILPSRKQLDDVIFHGHKSDLLSQYDHFIQTIKQIYDIVERYYAEKKYLQLP